MSSIETFCIRLKPISMSDDWVNRIEAAIIQDLGVSSPQLVRWAIVSASADKAWWQVEGAYYAG